jgi:lycopene beta-cyclase
MPCHDVIIVGAGAAGLSLALAMIRGPLRGASILLVDHDSKDRDDRTFAYWEEAAVRGDPQLLREWSAIDLLGSGFHLELPLVDHRYRVIRAIDFYRAALDELRACPGVEVVRAEVGRVRDGGHAASAEIDGARVEGRFVFDSRFAWREIELSRRRTLLRQHFVGWEVELPEPRFDADRVVLFDFREIGAPGEFFYLLPYAPERALVEWVGLRAVDAEARLRGYLERCWGVAAPRLRRREGGVSPLTDHRFRRRLGQRVMAIGVRGGRIKPSSGYAFARIRADAAAIVRSLADRGHPFDVPRDRPRYRFYDAVLLQVMRHQPEALPEIFRAMFTVAGADRVLAFLDGTTSFAQRIELFRGLPWGPFAAGFARLIQARVGLARRSS